MRPRYWLVTTLSVVSIIVLTIVLVNVKLDVYGLYRQTRGRHLPVFGDERVAKYLLSMRYVPENFNALLSGASISANWPVTNMPAQLRVYNMSLNGATIVEEKSLIESALGKRSISVVLLLVHPALTYSHDFRTADMTPSLKRSALGSLSLWDAYKDMIKIRLGRTPQAFDYAGTETPPSDHHEMNIYMKQLWSGPEFVVDPVALQAYRDLVANLRARGVQIVFIVPPTSEQLLNTKRAGMQRYVEQIHSDVGMASLWIDFLSPEYRELCGNTANFSDGSHLTRIGARQVVDRINTVVGSWIAERRLTLSVQ